YALARTLEIKERFWDHIAQCSHESLCPYCCWPWLGHISHKTGYGSTQGPERKTRGTHRIAWELHHQKSIPEGMLVCHYCHNRACCNPSHLHVGTYVDNMQDAMRDQRHCFGSRIGNSKLHETDIPHIFALYSQGNSKRAIARRFHVHHKLILLILNREIWKQ